MSEGPKLTALGKLVIFIFIIACIGGGGFMAYKSFGSAKGEVPDETSSNKDVKGTTEDTLDGPVITIGVAYGTEKKEWMKWAHEEFKKTPEGKRIKINLLGMGSLEAAKAIINGDERIHVWSPASAAYKDVFIQDFQSKYSKDPIISETPLVLSPMVFVMWKERYDALKESVGELNFETLRQCVELDEKGDLKSWGEIANQPDWGYFSFGHTNPAQSNSGVLAIVLAAYDFHKKYKDLSVKDIVDSDFQQWYRELNAGVSDRVNSTGTLMNEMIQKGPSVYDVVWVYENLAMSHVNRAKNRYGELIIVYPDKNIWNDNPYYLLDTDWSSNEQRDAAKVFQEFLLSKRIQQRAATLGFRPVNLDAGIKFPGSPFLEHVKNGVKINIPRVCEPPSADVLNNLLIGWERLRSRREQHTVFYSLIPTLSLLSILSEVVHR